MKFQWKKWVVLFLRLGFGVMLIAASVDKMRHPFLFAEAVENYLVFGEGFSYWVAAWVPTLEIVTGLILILGVWFETAVWINAILMLVFLGLVTQAFARGLDIRCGCFFVEGEETIGLLKILENTLFAALGIFLIVLGRSHKSS